jgi:TonB family protein
VLQPVSVNAAQTLVASTSYSILDILKVIYCAGVVVSLGFFMVNLIRLVWGKGIVATAWSFFGRVFIPAGPAQSISMMRLHEEAHVKQWHSVDIMFYQCIKALFWFNPMVYRLLFWLKETHEFSADAYAIKHTDDKLSYCELLLDETFGVETHALVSPFHSRSTILNRISMITQTQHQPVSWWKYVAVLPMLAAIMFLSFTPKTVQAQDKSDKVFEGKNMPEVMPEYIGGTDALMKYLANSIKYPADAKKEKVEGRVMLKFVVDRQGRVTNVENMKNTSDPRLVKEAIRVVEAMPAWKPGQDKGQPVDVSMALPVVFKLN